MGRSREEIDPWLLSIHGQLKALQPQLEDSYFGPSGHRGWAERLQFKLKKFVVQWFFSAEKNPAEVEQDLILLENEVVRLAEALKEVMEIRARVAAETV